jgi:glucokinase
MNDVSPLVGTAARHLMSAPAPWLVADIGGTNARFGWMAGPGTGVAHVRTLACAAHAGPAEAAAAYLAGLRDQLGSGFEPPRAAAWAVATAVGDDRITLTNSGWSFSRDGARAGLGLDRLEVLLKQALQSEAVKTRFAALSVQPVLASRHETGTYLRDEGARWSTVIKARGIKAAD